MSMENIEICCSHNVGIDGKDFTPECDCSCHQPIEEKWKRENCGHDVMKCLTEVEHLHKEIDILADYLLKHHHKEICGSAVDTAINIISGIPNLLEQERKKMIEEIVELHPTTDSNEARRGYDQARADILSIINK